MAERQSQRDRIKEITDGIEQGIKDLFNSDNFRQYLKTMSRFHHYSLNNIILIQQQCPHATHVAGFTKWKNEFGRNVRKGEKGIRILAPTPVKKKLEMTKIDPDTQMAAKDELGNDIVEEKEVTLPFFKVVSVFDVSQTDGRPLPAIVSTLDGRIEKYDIFLEALKRSSPVPIDFKPLQPNLDGYYSLKDKTITLREGMSEVQTVCAAVHEIAHSKLHDTRDLVEPENAPLYQEIEIFDIPGLFSNGRIASKDVLPGLYRYDLRGSDYDPGMPIALEERVVVNHAGSILAARPIPLPEDGRRFFSEEEGLNFVGGEITAYQFRDEHKKGRRTEEVEAESVAYSVCQYFHIETAENSFGYIAGWSQGKELKELRESLETINKTASELITDMEHHIGEICKERGIDLTPEVEGLLSGQDLESLYLVNDSIYLHVQKVDNGWDYTLYDKETLRLMDGGFMEDEVIAESPIARPIAAARTEIMAFEGIQPEKVVFWDLSYLDELQRAQDNFMLEEARAVSAELQSEMRQRAIEIPPDPTITVEHMHACGFKDADMLPISEDRAKELAERGIAVYQLFEDGTKHRVDDPIDICVFGGLYGITKQDWEQVRLDIPPRDVERRFMERPEPVMAIYQLKETAPHELLFERFDRLDNPPARENYDCIYVREVNPHLSTHDVLEQQFQIYNVGRPDDFTGHSLSMSDIVALKCGGEISYHYVDAFGFREVPNFQQPSNYLRSAEMQMEDDFGMIDGIINNGKSATTQPEKKPSVVEQLKNQPSSPKKDTPPKKRKEEVR